MSKPRGPLLGAHVPIAGGLFKAPPRAWEIGAEAAQIFTRNQLQWRADPIRAEEAMAFKDALGLHPLRRLVAHGSYLVNLASPDPVALLRSREAFLADMQRCHALGVTHLIFHAGAHLGAGEDAGLRTVAPSRATFRRLVRDRRFRGVPMILETPAGMRGWGREIRLLRALRRGR